MPAITQATVAASRPKDRPYVIWDSTVRGFGLRVHPTGHAVFLVTYRVGKAQRRVTLGRATEMSVKAARSAAADALAGLRLHGDDPLTERQAKRDAPVMTDLLDKFFHEFAPERVRLGKLTARTVREYRLQAAKHIRPALGRKRVADVDRADIEALLHGLPPTTLNRVHSLIRRLLNLAERWEMRPQNSNPAVRFDRAPETVRDRVLSAPEMAGLSAALNGMTDSHPTAIAAIKTAALTGLRISEVLAMEWRHVEFDSGAVLLPETKTGQRVHSLSVPALELLKSLPRLSPFCFTGGNGKSAAITYKTVRSVFAKAAAAAGLENVRLHDLRRTAISRAAEAGISAHILRDFLGHKSASQADKYIRQLGAPVREAREQVGAKIAEEMQQKPTPIIPLDSKRRGRR